MGSQEVESVADGLRRRERGLWLIAAAWVLLIYSTLYFVRAPIEFLRERNLLHLTVAAVFLLTAATVIFLIARRRPPPGVLLALAGSGIAYFLLFRALERPEEKLHLIQYGVLAGLIHAALETRGKRRGCQGVGWRSWKVTAALVLTTGLGWLDEGIQAILPNRYYDLRDVGLNLVAAAVALAAISLVGWADRASN